MSKVQTLFGKSRTGFSIYQLYLYPKPDLAIAGLYSNIVILIQLTILNARSNATVQQRLSVTLLPTLALFWLICTISIIENIPLQRVFIIREFIPVPATF